MHSGREYGLSRRSRAHLQPRSVSCIAPHGDKLGLMAVCTLLSCMKCVAALRSPARCRACCAWQCDEAAQHRDRVERHRPRNPSSTPLPNPHPRAHAHACRVRVCIHVACSSVACACGLCMWLVRVVFAACTACVARAQLHASSSRPLSEGVGICAGAWRGCACRTACPAAS